MPHFYFHLRVGRERCPDHLGVEFDSLEGAYLDAFEAAREMWSELLKHREDPTAHTFEICDADGKLLLSLPFTEVLEAARKPADPRSHTFKNTANLLKRMRSLAAALNEQVEHTRAVIKITRQTLHRSSVQSKVF